jgi:hypothetical protein
MARYLSKTTTIALFFLFVFLCSINEASDENYKYQKTTIYDLKQETRIQIIKIFLTLREALILRMTSKLFEKSTPNINTKNAKYFVPFLNFGYDKNIGFALARYCSTPNDMDDSDTLEFIKNNIENLENSKIFFNSYVFVFKLSDDNLDDYRVYFGGIGEYEKTIPLKCTIGEICELKMNENAIAVSIYTYIDETILIVGDPDYYTNEDPEKFKSTKTEYFPFCTPHTCSIWNPETCDLFSWGNFNVDNEIAPTQEKLLAVLEVASNDQAICVKFANGKMKAWGNIYFGGKIPENIQNLLIRTILSTNGAFTALTNDGKVFAWGDPLFGGKIPEEIQVQLYNVFQIRSAIKGAFAALTNDGKILTWGNPLFGGIIPEDIQIQLYNVDCSSPDDENEQFTVFFSDDDREPLSWPQKTL